MFVWPNGYGGRQSRDRVWVRFLWLLVNSGQVLSKIANINRASWKSAGQTSFNNSVKMQFNRGLTAIKMDMSTLHTP